MNKNIMTITKAFAIAFVLVNMTSCAMYKRYERADVNVPANVMRDANLYANTTDTSSFGDVAWREVFTDPQLQSLIQQGLDNNIDIYSAAANVQKLEAGLRAARLAFLPNLNFNPSGTLSKVVTGNAKGDWDPSYTFPISASWTTGLFADVISAKRNAEMSLAMSRDHDLAVRSKVICSIANMYYTLMMLDRQLEILVDMEKISADTYHMMQLQKDLGKVRETAVSSAKAANLSLQSQIVDMKRQIMVTENNLSLILAMPAQSISRGRLYQQSLPEQFSTGIAAEVLLARPDVHAAEMTLAACFYDVENARSQMLPKLNITGTGAWTNKVGQTMNPGQFLANIVGGLAQPIFSNGRITATIKVAEIQYEVAKKNWEQAILSAGAEVSSCLIEYNAAKNKSDIEHERVDALTKTVEHTRLLYSMGTSSYLEVLQAQSSLLQAEIAQLTNDFNKMQSVVNLYSALGGGRK